MKRILALLLACVLLSTCVPLTAFAADDSSPKHIPRIVSVVFDNSGSMYCLTETKNVNGQWRESVIDQLDRWAYASYAMQAFAALMSPEDELYVTYMNSPVNNGSGDGSTQTVSLSNKGAALETIRNTAFGGGTPNVIGKAVDKLVAKKQAGAEHFLVVMADGALNPPDTMQQALTDAQTDLDRKMNGESCKILYFSMDKNDSTRVDGVDKQNAYTGDEIIDKLKDVSVKVMGRTEIENPSISGKKVSFSLTYPALSIAVFIQKTNGSFSSGSSVKVQKDGQNTSFKVDKYAFDCPDYLTKNEKGYQWGEEKEGTLPDDPPAGLVALITNGDRSLGKGSFTIELPETAKAEDIVVMVEPAVRLQCKYYLEGKEVTAEYLKENIREGDKVEVECALYEIDENGELGSKIPESVLKPNYRVLVNGTSVGENKQRFTLTADELENKNLRVEAIIDGFQPITNTVSFDDIRPAVNPIPDEKVSLTKEHWHALKDGGEGFELDLKIADVLSELTLEVDGIDGLPEGACATLGDAVRMNGTKLIYTPKALGETAFASVPASFTVRLTDPDGKQIALLTVEKKEPQYKLEVKDELAGASLGLEMLKNNQKGIGFTLTADYDGSGTFVPVKENGCEEAVSFACDSGKMPAVTEESFGGVRVIPQYDESKHTDVDPSVILGSPHSVTVKATVDGKEVASETVSLSVNVPTYKVLVDNPITEAFTLDSIKTNQQKIVFRLQADYKNDGTFTDVADWDRGVYEKLTIDAGELPGTFATEYDAGGKPVGKSFVPLYDENNNNGVVFTKVAGKTHTVAAVIEDYDLRGETTVEVLAPVYSVSVRKDKISVASTAFGGNTEGVEFYVLRDGRQLNAEELASLSCTASFGEGCSDWLRLKTEVRTENEESYLACVPVFEGPWIQTPFCLFFILPGDVDIVLTVGEATGRGVLGIWVDPFWSAVMLAVLFVIAVIARIVYCYNTRVRIKKGDFYIITCNKDLDNPALNRYKLIGIMKIATSPMSRFLESVRMFLRGSKFRSFREQDAQVAFNGILELRTSKLNPTQRTRQSYPFIKNTTKSEGNKGYRIARVSETGLTQFLTGNGFLTFNAMPISDSDDEKMDFGLLVMTKMEGHLLVFIDKDNYEMLQREGVQII